MATTRCWRSALSTASRAALMLTALAAGDGSSSAQDRVVIVARKDATLVARIESITPLQGVRAGSALVWVGPNLLVAQDDSPKLVVIDPKTGRALESYEDVAQSKAQKPDYEAAFKLTDGRIVVVGSGSKATRREISLRELDGKLARRESPELYLLLEERLGATLNLEAAVLEGDRVQLLHRGVAVDGSSAMFEVPLDALMGGSPAASAPRFFDLGRLGGAALGFTDAVRFGEGRLLYSATAEDTPDPVSDGPIVGAALGIIEGDTARWTPLLEPDGSLCLRKPEGLALDPLGRSGWLVTDPDDPEATINLLHFVLEGEW